MKVVFFDTETHSNKNPEIIQLCCIQPQTNKTYNNLFKPKTPITFGAMAVHNITNEKISIYKEIITPEVNHIWLEFFNDNYIIAHNIKFDLEALSNWNLIPKDCKIIDTLKIAKIILQDIENPPESYSLQYLRYYLGLTKEYQAHDALGDVKLLIDIFNRLYEKYIEIETKENSYDEEGGPSKLEFLEIVHIMTLEPMLIKTFQFGKHIGKTIEQVNIEAPDYLRGLYNSESQKPQSEQNEDMIYTLEYFLKYK